MPDRRALAPSSLLVAAMSLIVSLAWNGFFNSVFNHISKIKFQVKGGPKEIALRFAYAFVLTVVAIIVVRNYMLKRK
jgi:uncharacterized membrane protein